MAEYFNEHEQGEAVKKWLRENGGAIVMGLVIAFGGLFGVRQWQSWDVNQKQRASAEFEIMSQLLSEDQLDAAMDNYQTLKEDFSESPYASLAALQMARARLDAGQTDLAVTLYQFVADNGTPSALKTIGTERLARVLLDQGKPEEAISLLDQNSGTTGFEASTAEVRGDIYSALGRTEEAIDSYQLALDTLEEGVGDRGFLELKLKSLGGVPAETESEDGNQS
ncbi:MAG TPA: tetratricopeptide repeat protein [Xanthomonadales bacterium]|nr:tetratricopeptide repeat protein [Xanthomonadales bacterium]